MNVSYRLIPGLLFLLLGFPACQEATSTKQDKQGFPRDTSFVNTLITKANKALKNKPDSSLAYLTLAKRKSAQVNYREGTMKVYAVLGRYFRQNALYDSALAYAEKSYALALQLKDEHTCALQLIDMATIYNQSAKYDLAFKTLGKADTLVKKLKDQHLQASYDNMTGNINASIGHSSEAVEAYLRAADLFETLKDEPARAILYNNLANIFSTIGRKQEAIQKLGQAAVINHKLGDYYNLAMNYINLGALYMEADSFQPAMRMFSASLNFARMVHGTQLMAQNFLNLGNLNKKLKNYPRAASYYDSARVICTELDIEYGKLLIMINTGELYMLGGNTVLAQQNLENALHESGRMNLMDQHMEVNRMLYLLFKKTGNYEQSLHYKERYDEMNDSILLKNNSSKIQELLVKSDEVKHEKEILELNNHIESASHSTKIITISGILVIMALGFLVFWFVVRSRKVRYENMLTEAENQTLRLSRELAMEEEAKLRKLNEMLEARVAERTKELEDKNSLISFHLKEIEQFTYITSHDLQEPLLTLTNYTRLLAEDYAGKLDDTGNKSIEFISGSAWRMKTMIKGLLDYSLLGQDGEMTAIDCRKAIDQVLAGMTDTLQEIDATIMVRDMPMINGHPSELSMLFQNLIDNAIKFRKQDLCPELIISCENHENEWEFSFADNGSGISEKETEKMFVIFRRMHSRNELEGTGLGLALCKKIVTLHGGTIRAESSLQGGCNILFTIPK